MSAWLQSADFWAGVCFIGIIAAAVGCIRIHLHRWIRENAREDSKEDGKPEKR